MYGTTTPLNRSAIRNPVEGAGGSSISLTPSERGVDRGTLDVRVV
jgi:hypothetical protein